MGEQRPPHAWLNGRCVAMLDALDRDCVVLDEYGDEYPADVLRGMGLSGPAIVLRWADGSVPQPPQRPDTGEMRRWAETTLRYMPPTPTGDEPLAADVLKLIDWIDAQPSPSPRSDREPCTGIAAAWCPNCGTCKCPEDFRGDRMNVDEASMVGDAEFVAVLVCPLHGENSKHPLAKPSPSPTPQDHPEACETIEPTGWHSDEDGAEPLWCAIVYRWPGGGEQDPNVPNHWTWELVTAGRVALDGTDTAHPGPILQRIVDLLAPLDVICDAAKDLLATSSPVPQDDGKGEG